ncbi:alcohol dehydrogenase [Pseudolabrys sp. Root1462]|uniref:quinone oxidoreductase family protein n=1 Tax=Pseudolabrys sp. Root1462 TaxID=1736466 RepID=UPI0007037F12|nr:quinone oxidoreductase [Pseudolabrys sp. Root1462]KQZ00753.1 alcohol dehydrogenase [Pseudolabrys sp. Root1462]
MDLMIRMTGPGGADRLEAVPCAPRHPNEGEIRIRHDAIGVNFIDIYFRSGLYPLPAYPAVLGVEGAGIVEAVGSGVAGLTVGDRIAYAGAPIGAYATTRLLPQARALRLPDGISTHLAAASMLRGLTAHMLLKHIYRVGPNTTLLVHAAAGGLGAMLVRWAKHLGATVIGTASSPEKAKMAIAHGADHVIVGRDADIEKEIRARTNGAGVNYAIDGIGGDMLQRTLACVRPFGVVASIGQAAGSIPPLSVEALGPRRSISLARPSVMAYSADPVLYKVAAADLFAVMARGIVPEIGAEYPLSQAAQAEADLESGRTTGSLLLIPD